MSARQRKFPPPTGGRAGERGTPAPRARSLPAKARTAAALTTLLLLAACAHQIPATAQPGAPGFFLGLVHGYIIIFSFIGSLFSDTISIYAVPNNGGWYNFGFALGAGAFGGSTASIRR